MYPEHWGGRLRSTSFDGGSVHELCHWSLCDPHSGSVVLRLALPGVQVWQYPAAEEARFLCLFFFFFKKPKSPRKLPFSLGLEIGHVLTKQSEGGANRLNRGWLCTMSWVRCASWNRALCLRVCSCEDVPARAHTHAHTHAQARAHTYTTLWIDTWVTCRPFIWYLAQRWNLEIALIIFIISSFQLLQRFTGLLSITS